MKWPHTQEDQSDWVGTQPTSSAGDLSDRNHEKVLELPMNQNRADQQSKLCRGSCEFGSS